MLILILIFISLKFSKLTEIWYRHTLLAYYSFNIYFFKILFIHIFCANGYINCFILIMTLTFIFLKFFSFIFFGLIWCQSLKFSILTEIWCSTALLYPYYDFNVDFFKTFRHSYSFGQIRSQRCSPN